MRPPKFDERLASQTARKMGMERGDGALGESASDTMTVKPKMAGASNP